MKNWKTAHSNIYPLNSYFINAKCFTKQIDRFPVIEFGQAFHYNADGTLEFRATPQPTFNKQFDLLASDLLKRIDDNYQNLILCANTQQMDRFQKIFEDIDKKLNSLLSI